MLASISRGILGRRPWASALAALEARGGPSIGGDSGLETGSAPIMDAVCMGGPVVGQGRTAPLLHRRSFFTGYALLSQEPKEPSEEEAVQEMAEAFEQLISEAYKLAGDGKVAEAEYLLSQGATQAEEIMGAGAVQVAPLHDQLALMQFMADRCTEAQSAARKAWDAVRTFSEQEGDAAARGAAASASVRLATTLVGSAQYAEAQEILEAAIKDLEAAIVQEKESDANEDMFGEKFEIAKAEGCFYLHLSKLAQATDAGPAEFEQVWPEMEEAVGAMSTHLGERHPLTACALRELHRVSEAAAESGRAAFAEAIFNAEMQLVKERLGPDGGEASAMMYQIGTMQYCGGQYEEAAITLRQALKANEEADDVMEENVLILRHRLALALGAAGHADEARTALLEISPKLAEKLGAENPVSDEAEYMLALLALRSEAAKPGGGDAALKAKHVGDMAAAVERLRGLGEGHPLVDRAEMLLNEAKEEAAQ